MHRSTALNTATLPIPNLINRLPWRRGLPVVLSALALGLCPLSPTAQAVLPSPTPDGAYRNGNTAEGNNALFSLTTGHNNTAVGDSALFNNTVGWFNVAIGSSAL